MIIDVRSKESVYITINGVTYYIDDSTDEQIVELYKGEAMIKYVPDTYAEGGEIGYEDKVIKELEELGYFEYNAKELYRKHRDTIDLSAKSSPKAMARALANTEGHTYAEGVEIKTIP